MESRNHFKNGATPKSHTSRKITKLIKMQTLTSPFDIAEDVVTIELPEAEYNNNTQTRFDIANPILATTWNTTQTFDTKGAPKDKDNDK